MEDGASLARLIGALRPWLGHLVIVGGWAHRLYRAHALAMAPAYPPVRTRDVDLALSLQVPLPGDIAAALTRAGFSRTLSGEHTPPVTYYTLEDDVGFYAEFLAPLQGGEIKRGKPDVTVATAGITAQKLRYLEVLLVAPWSVSVGSRIDVPLEPPVDVLLPNPVSFIVQKLLIHEKRRPNKQAQDLLSIHDTLELFGAALDELRVIWRDHVRPSMPDRTAKRAETLSRALFENITDPIRDAARIPDGRRLSAENLRAAAEYGLAEVLRD